MKTWEKQRKHREIGKDIFEEFGILMQSFANKPDAFKSIGQAFFACGAMAGSLLAIRSAGDIEQLQKLADDIKQLQDEAFPE